MNINTNYMFCNEYLWRNLPCRELSCSDMSSHSLHSSACMSSTALSRGFIAADFFSPFLASTRVHRTLGSDHVSLILMLVFAPIKDAHVVSSGRKTYSSGHPMKCKVGKVVGSIAAPPFPNTDTLLGMYNSCSCNSSRFRCRNSYLLFQTAKNALSCLSPMCIK